MCEIHERVNVECVQLFFKGFISHLIVKSKSISAIALSCKILQTLNNYLVNINIPHEIIWFRIFAVVIIFLCRQKPLKNPREYKKNDDWCVIWKKKTWISPQWPISTNNILEKNVFECVPCIWNEKDQRPTTMFRFLLTYRRRGIQAKRKVLTNIF